MLSIQKQNTWLKIIFLLLAIVVVFLSVAAFKSVTKRDAANFPKPDTPMDSNDIATNNAKEATNDKQAPVYFATMTHLESNWTQAIKSKEFFDRHATYLRTAYDLAQQYDAIITIETETPMAEGMIIWGDNLLQEALDSGQGVGTHCDIPPKSFLDPKEMSEEFSERKKAVDVLVDPSENLGCSGGGGLSDWYTGAVDAGFKYLDGIVGFHYLAVPLSQRPEGWNTEAILETYFHYGAPVEESKRFYPFRISRVGFEPDTRGDLVVSAGDIGTIQSIAELDGKPGWEGDCEGPCEFNRDDVDVLVKRILSVVESRDTSRLMKLQVYIANQYFADPDIEYFFQETQKLQEEGTIEWASQKQVYEAFLDWEAR